ncbi:AzlC family ABC transporter permease [Streptomyces sp. AV19]|uniref:AzlC family ABC transporter permease n=1 Tax=Streptomyces sp. AV19 TaxID=2793068 RepID=UPI0018FEA917|nr:AzlC family ABC transporter permease [Streptomyces sp. AV19]MBH1937674.1 AzlC family ABC transporter permease [Streptomyces sp. AV19]MDG4536341.1 AzlC family ABC transporter permease [Streptomyces sp. AV19]
MNAPSDAVVDRHHPDTAAPPPATSDFRSALGDSSSVGLALFPLGIAFGVLVVHAGLDWWWASAITAFVYAGSLEFLLVGLITAATPLAQVALTAFLVNFRHVFYALSFPLHRVKSRAGKAYSTYTMTDEAYALTTGESAQSWSGRRIVWLQALCQVYWVVGATLGAVFGALVPAQLAGLDFALTALFVVLAVDAHLAKRDIPTPVLALVCALVARFVLPGQMLLAALGLFTAGLLARRAFAPRRETARA